MAGWRAAAPTPAVRAPPGEPACTPDRTGKRAGYIASMKATIDFDGQLYRRLKVEAARRGRTVRELVAEGV